MKILDKIIRNIYNNSPEQNKLLAELLNKYLLTWKSNCITSQSQIDNAIKLREIFESFEDIDLNKETIELINLLPDLFEDKRNLCFWNSNIKNTDSEFVEFIEKLSSKIHY